ncbi:MAG: hypothetical protein NTZ25_04185 [Candidatus Peregrinibacteria bacterium]|nr:hypothetical protein [Candidatus Peregrinibacteria bacterium]
MTEVSEQSKLVNVDKNSLNTDSGSFFLAGNWIKTLVFAAIAFLTVFGTFMYEGSLSGKVSSVQAAGDHLEEITKFWQDNPIVFANTESATPIKTHLLKDGSYLTEVSGGKFWANFSNSTYKSEIFMGSVMLIPNQAVFDADFDGTKLTLNVYDGDVYVGFLPEKVNVTEYIDPYSPIFINRILVPRENSLSVPMAKVTEEIRPLLYSKLVKEFKLASITDDVKNSDWVKGNRQKDTKVLEEARQKFSADRLHEGAKVQSGFLSNFLFWSEENLTYMPDKKNEMLLNHLFDYLYDASYYSYQGNKEKSAASLQSFNDYRLTLDPSVLQSEEYNSRLNSFINGLKIFGPGDSEYVVLKALLNEKFVNEKERNSIVESFWHDVYRGLNTSDSLAEEALNTYYEYFDKTRTKNVKGEIDENFYKNYLAYQNQLFDNLLLKYPLFYKDGYFAIKTIFENDLLSLYPAGQFKDELKQAFVNNKINFMKRLRRFFFDGDLDVKQAKEIYKRLFSEITELMPKDDSGLGVLKLFESQLADMDDFWGYLNTPEYQSQAYGQTHEDRYKLYLQDRKTILSFENIKKDLLGEAPVQNTEKTIQQVTIEIQNALQTNKDVSNIEVGKIETVDQRYTSVKFVLGGYPVDANYDRDNDAVKDVKVYNQVVSDRAVKVSGLLDLLQQKFADLAKEPKILDKTNASLETAAQRFAKVYIAKKMVVLGFGVAADDVKIIDQLNAVYRIENVTFKDSPDLKVTFDVLMSGELITNVFLTYNDQPQTLKDKYTFEEFANMMAAEGQTSKSTPVDSTKGVAR